MIRIFERSRRTRLLLATLVTASLVVVSIDFRSREGGALESLNQVALTVLGPIQEGLTRVARPIGHFFSGFTQVPSLRARIADLERTNAELLAQREQVADIFRENESLRVLLDLRERLQLRTVAAQVIGLGPTNFERVLFINRGAQHGVERGMPVIGGGGLVGRVTSVGPTSSQVLTIVDRSNAVAGRLASGGETGILEGTGGTLLRFELLNPEAAVEPGDQVVTSGYDGGVYPSGIPIGVVADTPERATPAATIVRVRPFVDFTTLDYVLLVIGEQEGRDAAALEQGRAAGARGGEGAL